MQENPDFPSHEEESQEFVDLLEACMSEMAQRN